MLSTEEREELFKILKTRFEKHMNRHKDLEWAKVQAKLVSHTDKLWSVNEMERTGGEPDVVGYDEKTMNIFFLTVLWKHLWAGEMFATTEKGLSQEKNINRKIMLLIWQVPWESSF